MPPKLYKDSLCQDKNYSTPRNNVNRRTNRIELANQFSHITEKTEDNLDVDFLARSLDKKFKNKPL